MIAMASGSKQEFVDFAENDERDKERENLGAKITLLYFLLSLLTKERKTEAIYILS
jgi:hypothetical protein